MKQISSEVLCKYCLGCNKLEDENFAGWRRCRNFTPGYKDWRESLNNAYNKNKKHSKQILRGFIFQNDKLHWKTI